jgi:hypothetical protein
LAISLGIAAVLASAIVMGVIVHNRLFSPPDGDFVAAGKSPSGTWEARKQVIWPPAGGSFVWKVDVRSLKEKESEWRTVYLGPAGGSVFTGAPQWVDDETVSVRERRISVTGDGYVGGWLTIGEATLYWLYSLGSALLVLGGGVVLLILAARKWNALRLAVHRGPWQTR